MTYFQKSQASNLELKSAHKERQKFLFSIQKLTFQYWGIYESRYRLFRI